MEQGAFSADLAEAGIVRKHNRSLTNLCLDGRPSKALDCGRERDGIHQSVDFVQIGLGKGAEFDEFFPESQIFQKRGERRFRFQSGTCFEQNHGDARLFQFRNCAEQGRQVFAFLIGAHVEHLEKSGGQILAVLGGRGGKLGGDGEGIGDAVVNNMNSRPRDAEMGFNSPGDVRGDGRQVRSGFQTPYSPVPELVLQRGEKFSLKVREVVNGCDGRSRGSAQMPVAVIRDMEHGGSLSGFHCFADAGRECTVSQELLCKPSGGVRLCGQQSGSAPARFSGDLRECALKVPHVKFHAECMVAGKGSCNKKIASLRCGEAVGIHCGVENMSSVDQTKEEKTKPGLLLVSHTYVSAEPRKKLEALAAHFSLTCITVDSLVNDLGQPLRAGVSGLAGGNIVQLPHLGSRNGKTRYLLRGLLSVMRSTPHDLILVESEPWGWIRWQVWLYKKWLGSRAPVFDFSWENFERPGWKGWILRWFYRAVAITSSGVIAGNKAAAAIFEKAGMPPGKVLVSPQLGVDAELFAPVDSRTKEVLREKCGIGTTVKLAGFCGRFLEEKGLRTLLRSVAMQRESDPALELVLLGDGPLIGWLREEQGTRPWLHLLPPCTHAGVPEFLQMLDVFVLPSETSGHWQEQFGHVLIEAMSCGVPVVGSDCGAIPEVIGRSGAVVREKDPIALATAIRGALELGSDPAHRAALRERVLNEFTNHAIARTWAEFLRSEAKKERNRAILLCDFKMQDLSNRPRRTLEPSSAEEFWDVDVLAGRIVENEEGIDLFLDSYFKNSDRVRALRKMSILHVFRCLPRIWMANLIYCASPHYFWWISMFQSFGLLGGGKKKVFCFLSKVDSLIQKKDLFLKFPETHRVYFMTSEQVQNAISAGIPALRIGRITWRIDTEFYRPVASPGRSYILCAGMADRSEELIRELIGKTPIKLVRASRNHSDGLLYKEIKVAQDQFEFRVARDHREYLPLLQNAALCILPINPTDHPAGITAALEAIACKVPVLVSNGYGLTPLMRGALGQEPVADLNPETWLSRIRSLLSESAPSDSVLEKGRQFVIRHHGVPDHGEEWLDFTEITSEMMKTKIGKNPSI